LRLANRLANKFRDNGFELYEVGGSVRDSLLKRKSHDLDFTTNAPPEKIKEMLDSFGSVYSIGEKFGTIGLRLSNKTIEVTTYRTEQYSTNSRKPSVVFGKSILEDLSRRDFTINAIARDPLTGRILDPFKGIADTKNRSIKIVGSDQRFNEDPLRMLRAIRFACQLNFNLEVDIKNPKRLTVISNERICDELTKILLSRRAAFGIRELCNLGLMDYIIPELMELKGINQGKWHKEDAFGHSLSVLDKGVRLNHSYDTLVFRLACLLHDIGKPETQTEDETGIHFYSHQDIGYNKANTILHRLRFSSKTIDSVCHLIKHHMDLVIIHKSISDGTVSKRTIMHLVYRIGETNIPMLLDLVKCDIRSSRSPRYKFTTNLNRIVQDCLIESPKTLVSPVNGYEIMEELGLDSGQIVGTIKNYLSDLVLEGTIDKNDKSSALAKARDYQKTLIVPIGEGSD